MGDAYQGYLKSVLLLANAYVDLGTWDCLTPFVGVGVGGAYNKMADLVDMGIGTTGAGFGRNSSNFSPAWALYAGVDYAVTKTFSVELAYRYLNYGSVTDTIDCIGGCSPNSYKFSNLSSNDFMLGMRWRFPIETGPTMVAAQPASVMMPPAPVYTQPAPVYTQPAPVYTHQPMHCPYTRLSRNTHCRPAADIGRANQSSEAANGAGNRAVFFLSGLVESSTKRLAGGASRRRTGDAGAPS